ncbi:amidohydrolase [Clostridium swellfunianum]|uniref:amidohydrolase family protein n=1 Tax=Clostridium swellfunianum TaxID=1367462 RepID=UPI0020304E57|nr:amidohydrolase family protein [Clostridium swellfunianum]MCM0650092.1 amidohydrolase [Clostridium swellfunianum]
MYFKYSINDCHIHLFDSKDIDKCVDMIDYCGFTNWTHLACTVVPINKALTQNLLGALLKLQEGGRCQAFASFHYFNGKVPNADELLRQIKWFDEAGFDGIKMLDGKPTIRKMLDIPLDDESYDKMFDYAEKRQIPIMYHINDPIEFWYRDRMPNWAVASGNFYGDGSYPHKYEIDEETFRFLRKHPKLKICIPHFFFISDQYGLCSEMLDRYANLYFDITPGWEMFENFAKDLELWRQFFINNAHKILFGSDTFSDHWMETIACLRRVMETKEEFVAFEENCIGLDLPEEALRQIYYENYYKFVGRTNKKINVDAVLEYADTLYNLVQDGPDKQEVIDEINYLKQEIAKFK